MWCIHVTAVLTVTYGMCTCMVGMIKSPALAIAHALTLTTDRKLLADSFLLFAFNLLYFMGGIKPTPAEILRGLGKYPPV